MSEAEGLIVGVVVGFEGAIIIWCAAYFYAKMSDLTERIKNIEKNRQK
jgi:hypothetical protein